MRHHVCHAHGCGEPVPPALFVCRRHWGMLDRKTKASIRFEYQVGQETTRRVPLRYMAVQRRAVLMLLLLENPDHPAVGYYRAQAFAWRQRAIEALQGDPFRGLPEP